MKGVPLLWPATFRCLLVYRRVCKPLTCPSHLKSLWFLSSAIGRTLIPRYFRTVFEGGVTDLYYLLKHPKESFHNTTITLDCDQTTMVTHHGKPMFTKVRSYSVLFSDVSVSLFRPVCFVLNVQGHQGIFSLVKCTLWGNCKLLAYWSISRAPMQWPGSMEAIAFASGLLVVSLVHKLVHWLVITLQRGLLSAHADVTTSYHIVWTLCTHGTVQANYAQ